jgi:hypothetical protein
MMSATVNVAAIQYPDFWVSSGQPLPARDGACNAKNVESCIHLSPQSPEYKSVAAQFGQTMPIDNILCIDRIQNEELYKWYDFWKKRLEAAGSTRVERLFHGTSSTDPSKICDSQYGFQMQFSNNGMWGRGTYFAVNASYSNDYAFKQGSGVRQMLLCDVLVGDSKRVMPNDRTLSLPPFKDGSTTERHDSVNGETRGSDVFIVYENGRAFPHYVITYKE